MQDPERQAHGDLMLRLADAGHGSVRQRGQPGVQPTECYTFFAVSAGRHSRRTGCWNAPPMSVSAIRTLAAPSGGGGARAAVTDGGGGAGILRVASGCLCEIVVSK